jgi:hypothetical protein
VPARIFGRAHRVAGAVSSATVLRRKGDPDRAIADFWAWWENGRTRVEAAIPAGDWGGLPDEVGRLVDAIDGGLQWEFAPGTQSTHALVVTPAGNAELRALAARWRAAGPGADETWEYHTARQAAPQNFTSVLQLGDGKLEMGEVRFSFTFDEDRNEFAVVCVHPALPTLPEQAQQQIAFLALDWLLGEEATELWIGPVEYAGTYPDARPREELAEEVQALAHKHREPIWRMLQGVLPDGRMLMAMTQQPLRSARWPRFDTHAPVVLPFRHVADGGMPLDPSLFTVREFEDRLTGAVGTDGDLLAHETCAGLRTLHYYVDGASGAVDRLKRIVPGWDEGRAVLSPTYDPSLAGVRHLRG